MTAYAHGLLIIWFLDIIQTLRAVRIMSVANVMFSFIWSWMYLLVTLLTIRWINWRIVIIPALCRIDTFLFLTLTIFIILTIASHVRFIWALGIGPFITILKFWTASRFRHIFASLIFNHLWIKRFTTAKSVNSTLLSSSCIHGAFCDHYIISALELPYRPFHFFVFNLDFSLEVANMGNLFSLVFITVALEHF